MGWFSGLTGLAKLALVLAIITAVVGAAHWYNAGLIDQGRAEVTLKWSKANATAAAEREKELARQESEKVKLAKKYEAEKRARMKVQASLDKEREDAIKNSRVATNVCFDDKLRDNWDRASGYPGAEAGNAAGRGVAPAVP